MAYKNVGRLQVFSEFLPLPEWARGVEVRRDGSDAEVWIFGLHIVLSMSPVSRKQNHESTNDRAAGRGL
jgi:hypothetical protein